MWEKRPIVFWLKMLINVNGFAKCQPILYIEGINDKGRQTSDPNRKLRQKKSLGLQIVNRFCILKV